MSNWNTGFSKTNGMSIHYTRTGTRTEKEKSPLVLLHGLMTNGDCWTELAHSLEAEYDVIMPDARGHGKSSVPGSGYRYEDHAKDVIDLIKNLRLSAPLLIGHSMGGMTAAVIASLKPHLLRGVVLADPTFLSPKVQLEVDQSDVRDQHQKILKKSLEEVVKDAQLRCPHRSLDTLKRIAQARFQTSMNAFDVLTPPNPEFRQLVKKISVPCLLAIGDGGLMSLDLAKELQHLNPKLQVQLIQDASHGLHYDQPERFADVVKDFLSTISTPRTLQKQ